MELKITYIEYTSESRKYNFGAYFEKYDGEDTPYILGCICGHGQTKEEAAEDLRKHFLEEKEIINSVVVLDDLSRKIEGF